MRDARAREMDRPPFKVLGNGTLLEIAERKPRKLVRAAEIKGITDLLVRRLGREVIAAVKEGAREHHGPIPKLAGNGRRRMDRQAERRLGALKQWRSQRAAELALDPGRAVPELRARGDRLARAGAPRDLDALSRAEGLVRARVRRRGRRGAGDVDAAPRDQLSAAREAPKTRIPPARNSGAGGCSIWTTENLREGGVPFWGKRLRDLRAAPETRVDRHVRARLPSDRPDQIEMQP